MSHLALALRRSTILADARGGRLSQLSHLAFDRSTRLTRLDGGGPIAPSEVASIVHVRVGAAAPDVEADLAGATTVDEVDAVYSKYLDKMEVPSYIKDDYWVGRRLTGGGHTLDVLVAPDYGAVIGPDGHPFRIGKSSQAFAQKYADAVDAILPSQKLLADLEASADVKIPFIAVQKGGGADDSVEAVVTANDKAAAALEKAGATDDDYQLKIGYKKSYVTRPNLNGDYLAIYGGRWSPAGGLVQPTSGHAHTTGQISGTTNYADYSHGITLVSNKANLDGVPVNLRRDVFGSSDPAIWGLVSNEGSFDPVFPNAGAGSLAAFSTGSTGGGRIEDYSASSAADGGGGIEDYSASSAADASTEPTGGVDTTVTAPPTGAISGGAGAPTGTAAQAGIGGVFSGLTSHFTNLSTPMKVGVVALVALVGGGLVWAVVG